MINYPSTLPSPLFGIEFKPVDPQLRTELQNGRTRVRRNFTATPVNFTARWILTSAQATEFEQFYQDVLKDGSEWFMLTLLLPQGNAAQRVQFMGIYQGPTRRGRDVWEYEADLQMYLRP